MVDDKKKYWFVLRDLKRPNALMPGRRQLADDGVRVFTPMRWRLVRKRAGGFDRVESPVVPDLLFANEIRSRLDQIIERIPTLQYRFKRGAPYMTPLTVPDRQMDQFIMAVGNADSPVFYSPGELSENDIGRAVRISDGPMAGLEGRLLKMRGSRVRRLVVEIPSLIAASVEVNPGFIELL